MLRRGVWAPLNFDQYPQRARGTPARIPMDPHMVVRASARWTRPVHRPGWHLKRCVLRALEEAAMKTGSQYVAFGHQISLDRNRLGSHHRGRAPAGAAVGGRRADR